MLKKLALSIDATGPSERRFPRWHEATLTFLYFASYICHANSIPNYLPFESAAWNRDIRHGAVWRSMSAKFHPRSTRRVAAWNCHIAKKGNRYTFSRIMRRKLEDDFGRNYASLRRHVAQRHFEICRNQNVTYIKLSSLYYTRNACRIIYTIVTF